MNKILKSLISFFQKNVETVQTDCQFLVDEYGIIRFCDWVTHHLHSFLSMQLNYTKIFKFNLELTEDEARKLSDFIASARSKGVTITEFLSNLEYDIDEVLNNR